MVAAHQNPPVCKVVLKQNVPKLETKEGAEMGRQNAGTTDKKSSNIKIKEFEIKSSIGENDLVVKLRKMQESLAKGHSIAVTIAEVDRGQSADSLFKHFENSLRDNGAIQGRPVRAGRKWKVSFRGTKKP
ncbi:hypothetical protein HDU97_004630 [Phlyctochytrium planicorne]|nr:hypothetical protein HDU97_004630 [Phlyctochytrium planicorne]